MVLRLAGVPQMSAHAAEFWPLLLCGGLFIVGAVRFLAGAPMAAGARDRMRWFTAALCCVLAVAALVYLTRLDLPGLIGPPFGGVIAAAACLIPVWLALVGFMRAALLSWPRGAARGAVARRNRATKFFWPGERRFLFWRW
jgi:hypothetical protein